MSQILYSDEARQKLLAGIRTVANIVGSTLGPQGRLVTIRDLEDVGAVTTKDGVTVARAINLPDNFANIGVELLHEAAGKALDEVGDGPQPLYAKVLTPNGFVNISDLKLGDEICGTNKSTQKVIGIYPKGKLKIYKLRFSNGQTAECSSNHLWNVTTNYGSNKSLITSELFNDPKFKILNKDQSFTFKYYVPTTVVEFKDSLTDDMLDPYLVGLLLGDGSLCKSGSIELSLALNKEYVLDKIKLPTNIKYSATKDFKKNYIRVKFSRVENSGSTMHDYIDAIGLLNCRSGDKFIPKFYLYSSCESRAKLLEGLTDTDGHINKKGLLEYSTISQQLHLDVIELMRSLGKQVHTYLKERKDNSSYSSTPIYRISELKGYKHGIKLVDIEETSTETEMMCIKVSNPDSLYITNDYVLTHNTSTSTLITSELIQGCLNLIAEGYSSVNLSKELKVIKEQLSQELESYIQPVKDINNLINIATIAANNDAIIGKLIGDAFEKVGLNGIVRIEPSEIGSTYVNTIDGAQLNSGLISPHFYNQAKQTVLTDCLVLVTNVHIPSAQSIMNILKYAEQENKALVIVCDDITTEALASLISAKRYSQFRVAVINAPSYGEDKLRYLTDLATYTGGIFIQKDSFIKLDDINPALSDYAPYLGECGKVVANESVSTFYNGAYFMEDVAKAEEELKEEIKTASSKYAKEVAEKRLAFLTGGIATIYVGAGSELETLSTIHRVDDAVRATQVARIKGVVVGGGYTVLKIINKVFESNPHQMGSRVNDIVKKALMKPFITMYENAGLDYSKYIEVNNNKVFNLKTNAWEFADKTSILDPAAVLLNVFETAFSIASTVLLTEIIILNETTVDKQPKTLFKRLG